MVIATFFSVNPCNSLHVAKSYVSKGINDGLSSVIVCPTFFANMYPSPVDPVNG